VNIVNRSFPEYGWTVEDVRHEDSTWTDPKYFKARYVLDEGDRLAGVLDLNHPRHRFHARRYRCDVVVDPDRRRAGYGSMLFDFAIDLVRDRDGEMLIGSTKQSMHESVGFLTKRGCVERQRSWESRLDVDAFDFSRFAGAEERATTAGIQITTLAAEISRNGDAVLRKAFELEEACTRDIPSVDPWTEGSFELFRSYREAPSALPDAFFLAVKDGEYVGLSNLWKDMTNEANLYQGLTGVHPSYRGRGIAMALKLQTVKYARAHGKREIRTWNDTRNRPMLRINEAMGFAKQPVWIEFEKRV
jgi:mycothiol synthase